MCRIFYYKHFDAFIVAVGIVDVQSCMTNMGSKRPEEKVVLRSGVEQTDSARTKSLDDKLGAV